MIARKRCKCGCSKYPTLGYNGFNYACASDELKEKVGTKRQVQIRNKNKRVDLSSKLHKVQRELDGANNELELYFMLAATELAKNPYCENCGSFISKEYYHHATSHIFPKSIFKSIASHPMNRLFLGAHCCHDLSHRLDMFSQMKVFPIAINKFLSFEDQITERHKYLDLFKSYIPIESLNGGAALTKSTI